MKKKNLLFTIILIIGTISFTNCKKDKKLEIGQKYEGGIIFYLDGTGKHGMVCAESDQSSSIQWWNGTYTTTNATGTAIGTGNSNTNAIVSAQGTGNFAAKICGDLTLNSFSDWFLPSKDELSLMYTNLKVAGIGSFSNNTYWSSTEFDATSAWEYQFFSNGYQQSSYCSKNNNLYVRAVRTF